MILKKIEFNVIVILLSKMETRVNKRIDAYLCQMKSNIKEWFVNNNSEISGDSNISEFLKFIYDYDGFKITKDDLLKRKRLKNCVPETNRCLAKRANGEQCTRRKKDGCEFCGTHTKGTPHGIVDKEINSSKVENKREVWVQSIHGINYFIDSDNNVYDHTDVLRTSS